jgi:hypothetical protein
VRLYVADIANETAVIHIVSRTSNGNDVARRTHKSSGLKSHANIVAASGARECGSADGRVVVPRDIAQKRKITDGSVGAAHAIALQCLKPVAVLLSPTVLLKRANVPLAVLESPSVLLESAPTPNGSVRTFPGLACQRVVTHSRIVVAYIVVDHRGCSNGRVSFAAGVQDKRRSANARV